DIATNRLVVVQGHDHPALLAERVSATDLSWVSGEAPRAHWVYNAKTRYRQKDTACTISRIDANDCVIDFAEPQWAATPGQSVVVYESRVCLGGGIIEHAEKMSGAVSIDTRCPPGSEPFAPDAR
ncbi:MAG: hypothetical protein OEZ08_00850, partial [Betaproteobacteria bacterium]|nr:hypothetical protein [Betaproteobacteria bacterium]